MRRPLPALATAATAGLLVVGAAVAQPATAATAATAAAATAAAAAEEPQPSPTAAVDTTQPTALLRGTLRVLADVDRTESTTEHPETAAEHEPTAAYLQVGGVWVPLQTAAVDGVTPGSAVTVQVEVPRPVVAAVEGGRRVDATADASSAATTTIAPQALAAAQDAPASSGSALARASAVAAATASEPVAADVVASSAPAAAAVTSAQDVTVVAISMMGGSDAHYTDAGVDDLITSVHDYWSQQTAGAVGFRRDGAVTRYSSSLTCSNPNALWNEAAQRAGFTGGAGEHLLLLLPPKAYAGGCSYGLGSVGASAGAGGVAYVTDASWPAIAHELGHNMSLLHADRLQCGSAVDQAVGTSASYTSCTVQPYGDRTDVMSSAAARADGTPLQATGSSSAMQLARLGVLGEGGRASVTASGTTTWTVRPLSALSGLRAVRVTDPRSGDVYQLEVRANAGRDTYGWSGSSRVTYGLRVLKTGADGGSLLLDPTPTTGTDSDVVVAAGTTFTSAAGGVAVRTAVNGDGSVTAQVSVAAAGQQHWSGTPTPTPGSGGTATTRVQGQDRFGTAVSVSGALVPTPPAGGQRVYVASGATFPDALAAGAAAGLAGSTPVLLVPATGALPAEVVTELQRLHPDRATVVGGPAAVSEEVVAQLRRYAGSVERVAGADRYATGAAVARAAAGAGTDGPVFLATGLDHPDALAGAAAAAGTGGALLLTDPGTLPEVTRAALQALDPAEVFVLGGRVSQGVLDQVGDALPDADVHRVAGEDRYETAALVAEVSHPDGAATVALATGEDFPDALSGGPLAAAADAPLLLVQRGCAPGVVADQVAALGAEEVVVLGGPASVSERAAALTRC